MWLQSVKRQATRPSAYNPAVIASHSPQPDPYAQIAALYDLEHAGYDDDIDLYLNLALSTGDPILELGCGTGRLLLPLAEAGHRITGVDLSLPMLDRARSKVAEAGLVDRVTLHRASMTDDLSPPGGPFGLAIVSLNGLMHLTAQREQRRALEAVRRCLDPRGQLVLDVLNPTPETLRSLDHSLAHEGTWVDRAGARIDKVAARRILPSQQTIMTELWYDRIAQDGVISRVAASYGLRYLHRAEMDLLLELAGFAEWQIYGGYDLEPFDDQSDRIIVTAEVTASVGPRSRSTAAP